MERIIENNLVVVVGSWNPHIILNPAWLKKFIFPEQQKFQVSIEFGPNMTGMPVVAMDDIKMSLVGSRLCFTPLQDTADIFVKIEDILRKIADFLPHTPVTSYGINFSYKEKLGTSDFINMGTNLFESIKNGDNDITSEQIKYSFKYKEAMLSFNVVENVDEDGKILMEMDFNFNHQVGNLAALKGGIDDTPISEYLDYSDELVGKTIEDIQR